MWSYYGAKTNIIDHYPPPKYGKIIEPFAGTARYALKYFDREVVLVDKYDVIVKIWKWLQQCSKKDILSLPRFKAGDNINDYTYDCEAQRYFVGYSVGFGFTTPRDTATPRLGNRPNQYNYNLKKTASQLFKIRHWGIQCKSYDEIPNEPAVWFIDPPYQHGGHAYKESNKKIDYVHLANWSRDRKGQVIVCENSKADWMDFKPFITQTYYFGDREMKETCLWLRGLPPLLYSFTDNLFECKTSTEHPKPLSSRMGNDGKIKNKYFVSRMTNAKDRSKTFPGIAKAMAEQWG